MEQFGDYLRSLRTAQKITLDAIASMLHTSRSALSRLENGESKQPFKGRTRQIVIGLAGMLCGTQKETERYLQLAKLDLKILSNKEEIYLGFMPTSFSQSTWEKNEELLALLEGAHSQYHEKIQEAGNANLAASLARKCSIYAQAIHTLNTHLEKRNNHQIIASTPTLTFSRDMNQAFSPVLVHNLELVNFKQGARPVQNYFSRPIFTQVCNIIQEAVNQDCGGVALFGPPMVGKTRMILEALKQITPTYLLITLPRHEFSLDSLEDFSNQNLLLFLDDLHVVQ